jgi:2-oxoglutarate dehydrogenase E2 component (dihydrolipoamide succinyltransferase)
VTRWLKAPGDRVEQGEAVVEVETEKVNAEVESPATGRLVEIVAGTGTRLDVGAVIARIEKEAG